MRLFMFAASLQQNSLNKKLINIVEKSIKKQGHQADLADFSEFNVPLYNADIQNQQGFPKGVLQFIERMHQSDGLIISSPEYNFSTPGTLKNLIDWVSRVSPMPWQRQRILLLSASPSLVGGNRGLWSTRIPLEGCGSHVFPDMFSLAAAHEAFDSQDQLKDLKTEERLVKTISDFLAFVHKVK